MPTCITTIKLQKCFFSILTHLNDDISVLQLQKYILTLTLMSWKFKIDF